MATITLTEQNTIDIARFIELKGILKVQALSSQTTTEQGIADRAEYMALITPYREAVAAYKALSGLVKQNVYAGVSDADAVANRNERARVMALFTAQHINIEDLGAAFPFEP